MAFPHLIGQVGKDKMSTLRNYDMPFMKEKKTSLCFRASPDVTIHVAVREPVIVNVKLGREKT